MATASSESKSDQVPLRVLTFVPTGIFSRGYKLLLGDDTEPAYCCSVSTNVLKRTAVTLFACGNAVNGTKERIVGSVKPSTWTLGQSLYVGDNQKVELEHHGMVHESWSYCWPASGRKVAWHNSKETTVKQKLTTIDFKLVDAANGNLIAHFAGKPYSSTGKGMLHIFEPLDEDDEALVILGALALQELIFRLVGLAL